MPRIAPMDRSQCKLSQHHKLRVVSEPVPFDHVRADELCTLAARGDVHLLERHLHQTDPRSQPVHVLVNGIDSRGWRPLLYASHHGNQGVVQTLLTARACCTLGDKVRSTALHKAVRHPETLALLLAHVGADDHMAEIVDSRGYSPLHSACSTGAVDSVRMLLQMRSSPNLKDGSSKSPLMLASSGSLPQYSDVLQVLLDFKADYTVEDRQKMTALLLAARAQNRTSCQILLKAGASPDVVNKQGRSIFHEAIQVPDVIGDVVAAFPSRDHCWSLAAQSSLSQSGTTPLFEACCCGSIPSVKRLVHDVGVPIHGVQGGDARTILHAAAAAGHAAVMEQLLGQFNVLKKCDIQSILDARDRVGQTSLHLASLEGHHDAFQILLQAKASCDCIDGSGNTPLHCAVMRGYSSIVRHLVQECNISVDNVNRRNHLGDSALQVAARSGEDTIVEHLLTARADLLLSSGAPDTQTTPLIEAVTFNQVDTVKLLLRKLEHQRVAATALWRHDGLGPLHVAAYHGGTCCLQALIDHMHKHPSKRHKESAACVDISGREPSGGVTPLMSTACHGQLDACKYLVEQSANLLAIDHRGRCVFHHAAMHGVFPNAVVEHLAHVHPEGSCTRDLEGNTPWLMCCSKGFHEFAKYWLQIFPSVNVNEGNSNGMTALHFAVQAGVDVLVEFLVRDKGADIDVQNAAGDTPLHVACKIGFVALAADLIRLGSNINSPGLGGQTPLMVACVLSPVDQQGMLRMLVHARADISAIDENGRNVLHHLAAAANEASLVSATFIIRSLPCVASREIMQCYDVKGRRPTDMNASPEWADLMFCAPD